MFNWILPLFSFAFLSTTALATASGPPTGAISDCNVQEKKFNSIPPYFEFSQTPDRKVVLLFSPHLDPIQQNEMWDLLNKKDRSADTLKKRRDLASNIRKENQSAIAAKRREIQILDALNKKSGFRWLAEEAPDEDVKSLLPKLYITKITFEKTMAESGIPLREIDDVLLLVFDSLAYWQTLEPSRIQKFQRYGFENQRDHQTSFDAIKDLDRLKVAMKDFSDRLLPVPPALIESLNEEVKVALGEKRTDITSTEQALIQKFPSPETQELALQQLQTAHNLVKSMIQRDLGIAKKILNVYEGSGILTLGLAHQKTLSQALIDECLAKKKETNSEKDKPRKGPSDALQTISPPQPGH